MSTRSENTVIINHPVDKVHAALTSRGYWENIAANLSPEAGEVNEFTGNTVVLFEVLPTSILPEAVRAMVTQALKEKRTVTIGELVDDQFFLSFTADVKGTPVDFKGDVTYVGQGEQTVLNYVTEVSVNIPLMGAAIEPKVADALQELYSNEAKLAEDYISANA